MQRSFDCGAILRDLVGYFVPGCVGFCDDFLKTPAYQDYPNTKMTLAEFIMICIVATRFFYDNREKEFIEHLKIKVILRKA